jgi:hypothetical protein
LHVSSHTFNLDLKKKKKPGGPFGGGDQWEGRAKRESEMRGNIVKVFHMDI